MRSIFVVCLVGAGAALFGCADVLGIEPWQDPLSAASSSSSSGSSSGDTGDTSSSSGGVDPCRNGVQDGVETGVDCGGGVCAPCGEQQGCLVDSDCDSGYCPMSRGYCIAGDGRAQCGVSQPENPSCGDCLLNGTETDIDCGGDCLPCRVGKGCVTDGDCWSGVCMEKKCASGAPKTRCFANDDCASNVCVAAVVMSDCVYENCCQ